MSDLSPREIVSELDRFHCRSGGGQARRRHRAAQPVAASAPDVADARGGHAEEHPDDRPDRLRQDRDRAPPRQARRGAVPEGRGDEIHRGRLCRARRRADRPRSDRGRDRDGQEPPAQGHRSQGRVGGRRTGARRAGRLDLVLRHPRRLSPQAARGRAQRQGDRGRIAAERLRHADVRTAEHARRFDRRDQHRRHLRQEAAAPRPSA